MATTDYGSQGSKKYFELSAATEYTPLFENVSKTTQYDPTKPQISSSTSPSTGKGHRIPATIFVAILMIGSITVSFLYSPSQPKIEPLLGAAWSSKANPFSIVDPADLGIQSIDRLDGSQPGPILSNLMHIDPIKGTPTTPLPTNTWYQNLILGDSNTLPENKIFQIPNIIDAAGFIAGIRTHPCHLQSNDRMVMMTFEPQNGLSLGAVETYMDQHYVHKHEHDIPATISKLAIELEWVSKEYHKTHHSGSTMRSPIVRGSPYTSMKYFDSTPRIFAERSLGGEIIIDNNKHKTLQCGQGSGKYSKHSVLVEKEIKFHLDQSDMTWLVFVSEPTEFICSEHKLAQHNEISIPGEVPVYNPEHGDYFDLKAVQPMRRGMVRIAMANNCTTGQNPQHCDNKEPRDQSQYEALLRRHSPIYPTSQADIQFTFPVSSSDEEELRLNLNWHPANMFDLPLKDEDEADDDLIVQAQAAAVEAMSPHRPKLELLMFALPHHQERLRPTDFSSNEVKEYGCHANLHGTACPVLGSSWSMVEHLHPTSFTAPRRPRQEMIPAIQAAVKRDIHYSPPQNYMDGAGDTYFSGKMLAKLARILIVANEVGGSSQEDFDLALDRLRRGIEIWFKPSAGSPFLYDRAWGGLVSCGCDYKYENEIGFCANKYPNCPALSDHGQNFGAGFYNDHHYHYGYHIYAASVVAKFNQTWGREFSQHILLLVRDIVNPSEDDSFFPTWRHKDWYLGFSWASGVVTLSGKPYPNGRNQESASEAIAAYEGVALYGEALSQVYRTATTPADARMLDTAERMRDMGRLLMATEIRSMLTYWHVQAPGTPDVARVYPADYTGKVIGMMWSTLAQLQTWFGNEPWKSYGIQLMPITAASELRDHGTWVAEMLPQFNRSCLADTNCAGSGWEVLIYTCMSTIGQWRQAWHGAESLNETAYLDAGGDGHSLSNTLWYISTRPEPNTTALALVKGNAQAAAEEIALPGAAA